MKIGLNATCFGSRPSGAKQRFLGLYSALFRALPDCSFTVFEPADHDLSAELDVPDNVCFVKTPLLTGNRLQKLFVGKVYWRLVGRKYGFDLFEDFHLPVARIRAHRRLYTVHDIRRLALPAYGKQKGAYRRFLKQAIATCDRVITVSDSARREFVREFPAAATEVVWNGVELRDGFSSSASACNNEFVNLELPKRYLLAVGHLESRKNYSTLIDAMTCLAPGLEDVGLVIVGNDSGKMSELDAQVHRLGLSARVQILSGLSNELLGDVYRNCSAFVFPSVYEGFGIPILEAMVAGCPMALSDIPVFREIAADSARYFDPNSTQSLAAAAQSLLEDISLTNQLVAQGNIRVEKFGFDVLAQELASLYRELLSPPAVH